jgi:hypothetical protein
MVTTSLANRAEIGAVERAKRTDPATLAAMVELDPEKPAVDQARLAVWAIVNHVGIFVDGEIGDDVDAGAIAQTARDYMIPVIEVVAALRYYQEHRAEIDWWRERQFIINEAIAARARPVSA